MRFTIPHYAIFLLSVLLPWTFFAQSLSYAVEADRYQRRLDQESRGAEACIPHGGLCQNMINLLLSLIPLAMLVPLLRHPVLLDVVLSARSRAGADHFYDGHDVLLRRGQCVLP